MRDGDRAQWQRRGTGSVPVPLSDRPGPQAFHNSTASGQYHDAASARAAPSASGRWPSAPCARRTRSCRHPLESNLKITPATGTEPNEPLTLSGSIDHDDHGFTIVIRLNSVPSNFLAYLRPHRSQLKMSEPGQAHRASPPLATTVGRSSISATGMRKLTLAADASIFSSSSLLILTSNSPGLIQTSEVGVMCLRERANQVPVQMWQGRAES